MRKLICIKDCWHMHYQECWKDDEDWKEHGTVYRDYDGFLTFSDSCWVTEGTIHEVQSIDYEGENMIACTDKFGEDIEYSKDYWMIYE